MTFFVSQHRLEEWLRFGLLDEERFENEQE